MTTKRRPRSNIVDIGVVRQKIKKLEAHYGSLPQVAEVTGVSYPTLQGILFPGKLKGVTTRTADKIDHTLKTLPESNSLDFWNKRYVPVEKVLPLAEYLLKVYGSWSVVSEAVGVPAPTLRDIKLGRKKGVKVSIAQTIVDHVLKLRRGDRTWSTYEETDVPTRMATSQDAEIVDRIAKWRPPRSR